MPNFDHYINLNNVNNVSSENPLALLSFHKLPLSARTWLWFEQTHNPKIFDKDFFPKPDDINLEPEYLPENRSILTLSAYIIPKNQLSSTIIPGSSFANKILVDDKHVLLLVHPSLKNDNLMLKLGFKISNRNFFFLPAASARTGLTWEHGKEYEPFFLKMSIGGNPIYATLNKKTDLGLEGVIAVAKSSIFSESCTALVNKFFQDQMEMQLIPDLRKHTQSSLGLVFRKIPNEVIYRNVLYVPFFALAHTPTSKKPLFITLLENSGNPLASIEKFFSEYIFKPVIDFILKNAVYGVYADHLHGQNLLFKLDHSDKLRMISEVIYRDVPDMKVDEQAETAHLKKVRDQQNAKPTNITPGTYIYLASIDFTRRSLEPILTAINTWQKNGLFSTDKQNSTISTDKLIYSFFNQLLTSMQDYLSYDKNSYYSYHIYHNNYFNSFYEFLACTNNDNKLFKNTPRERLWHNILLSHLENIYGKITGDVTLDPERQNKLKEYLKFNFQDSIERYLEIDQINAKNARDQQKPLVPIYYNQTKTPEIRTSSVLHDLYSQDACTQSGIIAVSDWRKVQPF